MSITLKCCDIELFDGYSFLSHFRNFHSKNNKLQDKFNNNIQVNCPLCSSTSYKTLSNLKAHFIKYHPDFMGQRIFNFESNYSSLKKEDNSFDNLNDSADFMEVQSENYLDNNPVPSLPDHNITRPMTKDQHFALLLQNEILNNRTTQSTVNSVSTNVLNFVKATCDLNDHSQVDNLINLSKSSYLQEKKCNEVLDLKELYKEMEINGGKFYYADLRVQLNHILKKQDVVIELLKDKFGNY